MRLVGDVYRLAGIDPGQLSRLESGRSVPTVGRLMTLAEVYGILAWKILQSMEKAGDL